MLIEYDSYNISRHYITTIEYGDNSALNDQDETDLDKFMGNLPAGYKCWQYGENADFTRDDISGLMADCIEVKLFMDTSDI